MTQQTIEVEGFPEGWNAISVDVSIDTDTEYVRDDDNLYYTAKIKLEKIQPRRIVLEETEEVFSIRKSGYRVYDNGIIQYIENAMGSDIDEKIWREVKE